MPFKNAASAPKQYNNIFTTYEKTNIRINYNTMHTIYSGGSGVFEGYLETNLKSIFYSHDGNVVKLFLIFINK